MPAIACNDVLRRAQAGESVSSLLHVVNSFYGSRDGAARRPDYHALESACATIEAERQAMVSGALQAASQLTQDSDKETVRHAIARALISHEPALPSQPVWPALSSRVVVQSQTGQTGGSVEMSNEALGLLETIMLA